MEEVEGFGDEVDVECGRGVEVYVFVVEFC